MRRASNGRTLFPPFAIRQVGGVRIAFVGVTLEGTPQIVTPSGVAGLRFGDEAAAINRLVPRLRRRGVQTIVARVGDDRPETRLVRLARPVANRVIGRTAAPITRAATPAGESALGDVIADGQLAATSGSGVGGAQIALMNPGGIRADLPAGDITYNTAFTVQPFGNSLVP